MRKAAELFMNHIDVQIGKEFHEETAGIIEMSSSGQQTNIHYFTGRFLELRVQFYRISNIFFRLRDRYRLNLEAIDIRGDCAVIELM